MNNNNEFILFVESFLNKLKLEDIHNKMHDWLRTNAREYLKKSRKQRESGDKKGFLDSVSKAKDLIVKAKKHLSKGDKKK